MKFFNSNSISSIFEPLNFPLKLNFFFGNIAFISLFIAVLFYWFDFFDTRQISKKLKNSCMIIANISLAFLLLQRWYESGHFPLSNLYESLIGLSWGFTTVHLVMVLNPIEFFSKIAKSLNSTASLHTPSIETNNYSSSSFLPELNSYSTQSLTLLSQKNSINLNPNLSKKTDQSFHLSKVNDKIGAITAPTALLTSVFATFFLPSEITQASALIPALKSNWLTMHVTVMVASYAFLLIGSLLSITYCVYRLVFEFLNFKDQKQVFKLSNSEKNSKSPAATDKNYLDLASWLNTTSYRILGLGFPLLTIGILSGAVWANEAWGSYWSWDPKETWALITWLVFAVYFHSRYTRSFDSFVPATIASLGFVVIWICYLGVNLLGTGLHSYGWFSS